MMQRKLIWSTCIRCTIAVGALLALLTCAAPASAESPWWHLTSSAAPTNLPPGGEGQIVVTATNIGDGPVNGNQPTPVTITDNLPEELEATHIEGVAAASFGPLEHPGKVNCKEPAGPCTFEGPNPLLPYESLEIYIKVKVKTGPSGGENQVTVTGGGAPPASIKKAISSTGEATPFGIEEFEVKPENEGGSPATQAGSHPFQLTTALALNENLFVEPSHEKFGPLRTPVALPKDVKISVPPGLVGNPLAVPQCTEAEFVEIIDFANKCPADTAIGVASATILEPFLYTEVPGVATLAVPVFNLVPAPGEPARFGFEVDNNLVFLNTSVRTGGDYAVVTSVTNVSQVAALLASQVTLWGVPGDKSHDQSRGWSCINGHHFGTTPPCVPQAQSSPPPFLTLPTLCTAPLVSTIAADSWREPGVLVGGEPKPGDVSWKKAESKSPALEGCNQLPFTPTISAQPDQQTASTPTGFKVKIDVPQSTTLTQNGLAEASVKDTTVALPVGVQASPAAAGGLLACSAGQVGFEGSFESPPGVINLNQNSEFSASPAGCPDASKIGTVRVHTPLLPTELTGSLYLASQDTNPFRTPLVLYLIAEGSGVRVKLAGEVAINQETGQLVSTFHNAPPLPFDELVLSLFGGPRASQATPSTCGTYTTTTSFTPWSGTPAATPSSAFTIGQPCPTGALPFAPGFQAGSVNNQAGGFTPFTLTINRPDGNQALKSITMKLPPGIAAMLSSVTPCPEPPAGQEWNCGPASEVGHSTSSSGLGPQPFTLGGKVYLTVGYGGAPFGLLAVTPAIAGPFNLGNVVVRSKINVDPNTAAVTVTSDPLPQMLKGVPTQIKQLNVTIDRSNFQFNPTNCSPMTITGTLAGYEGASAPASSPFQVANCANLPFHPIFTASTLGHTSKANGAALNVKIVYPPGAYANVAKAETALPISLPSRLTTIQKACRDTIFEVNPARCPEGSVIGSATAHTPVLKNPLTGPAYLVSHGNRSFPDVVFVLQGEGITIVLDGQTDIKKGITKNTFNAVPDAPISVFELTLPEGPHSALAANVNLCAGTKTVTSRKRVAVRRNGRTVQVLKTVTSVVTPSQPLPTTLTGQNGAVLKQTTQIAVLGCQGAKAATHKRKASKRK